MLNVKSSSIIKILPENLANKIAAGEVVQRPESVVKELMENSIDAGAGSIDLIIKKAGKSLIQVFDDGSGMSEEDAVLCIQKHATSKIFSYDDLERINTFGFRGEALSSIASVSQLEIRTERKEDETGILVRVEGTGEITLEKGSFPKGTSVSVKNLFYNIPARRNFLKTDATELKHLIDTFNKISLSYPEINFNFYNDSELIFNYNKGNLENRIKEVFADNMLDALVPVEERTEYLSVYGYIGKPSFLKKSKGSQFLFLNRRYVQSRQINHAVFSAYENILDKGDYPFFILFVEINPEKIDVNIHPSKLEVRFNDEKDIYNFILAVVKKSLGMHDLVPSVSFKKDMESPFDVPFESEEKIFINPFSKENTDPDSKSKIQQQKNYSSPSYTDDEIDLLFGSLNSPPAGQEEKVKHPFDESNLEIFHHEPKKAVPPGETESPFLIQLHNKYILSQIKSGLMIVDQHAAHERILYEKALKKLDADLPFSQQLLFPKTLKTDPGTFLILKEINPFLFKLGFEIKFFSGNTVVIEGVPDDIQNGNEEKILLEIIDEYLNNQKEKKLEERDNLAKSYSCHTAIRAGERLDEREMRSLIDQLFATSMPYVCPHGRPIVVKLSLDEFDRRFGRT
jgi:DNA mismatch repair protein MutL